jgi:hypothetical protein
MLKRTILLKFCVHSYPKFVGKFKQIIKSNLLGLCAKKKFDSVGFIYFIKSNRVAHWSVVPSKSRLEVPVVEATFVLQVGLLDKDCSSSEANFGIDLLKMDVINL